MRFSLRDMILATTVLLLAIGWTVDRRRLADRISEMEFRLRSSQGLLESRGWTTSVDDRGIVFERKSEIEAAIARSIELGAPQPAALPPGYGEKPNTITSFERPADAQR